MKKLSPAVKGITFSLTAIAVLKLFAYLTCGKYTGKTRMDGKTVIVTGATRGIGKETARDLAKRGARVILACRDTTTANAVRGEFIESTGNKNIVVKKLDLSSLKSVREFAKDFLETEEELHVLIHNAGTGQLFKHLKNEDGIEYTMATNYFGPFLLTHLLIDVLKRSAPSRIILVSSVLYNFASLNVDNLNPIKSFPLYVYCLTKLCNVYFCHELARRLDGTNVTANCLHPGLVDTAIWQNSSFPFNLIFLAMCKMFYKGVEEGAQTSIYAAVSEDLNKTSGQYFKDCSKMDVRGFAQNITKEKLLWEKSKEIVQLTENDPQI